MATFRENDIVNILNSANGFGIDVEWAGRSDTIRGIFDDPYTFINASTGGLETSAPQVHLLTSDIVGIKHGDRVVIESRIYKVSGIQPDGQGMTLIILKDV